MDADRAARSPDRQPVPEKLEGIKRSPPSYLIQQTRILEGATRRYLAAVRELARVRKLQANTPASFAQYNTQINVR